MRSSDRVYAYHLMSNIHTAGDSDYEHDAKADGGESDCSSQNLSLDRSIQAKETYWRPFW